MADDGLRVLVCGGRDFSRSDAWNWLERNAYDEISRKTGLYQPFSISALIHGGARGADEGAADWGRSEDVPIREFKADWKKHGNSAGPIRNQLMFATNS